MDSLIGKQAADEAPTKQEPPRIEFMFRYRDGRRLFGSYYEYDGMVRVTTGHGTKVTQVGESPADSLAYWLARELADEFETARRTEADCNVPTLESAQVGCILSLGPRVAHTIKE
jgi:hypothetical protein